jgi:hypothetical protein
LEINTKLEKECGGEKGENVERKKKKETRPYSTTLFH